MTTDQTIDGVPRELIERVTKPLTIHDDLTDRIKARDELRALLDAEPAPCAESQVEPSAQPHGVPVAYADPQAFDNFKNLAWRGGSYAKEWMWAKPAPGLIPLYTEQPAPVADPLAKGFTTLESDSGKYKIVTSFATRDDAWSAYRALLGAKPALVAVAPDRDSLRDIIAQAIGGDTYDCVRVWSAWGVGTMSDDDFIPIVDHEERLYEIADTCLDELKRLNPSM